MPFPLAHSARAKSPDDFEPNSFRTNTLPNGVVQILGKLKGQSTMTVQAFRFPKDKFTPEQARKWLADHNIKIILFEPASENKALEYVDISNVEVFKEGTHNGDKYDANDIDDFVSNFKELKDKLIPKVKITHAEEQKSLAGLASYGDVKNVFTKIVGGIKRLFVDLIRVPDEVANWIKDGRFAERSIEVFRNITVDGKKFKNVLAKVSLLGHEIPSVSGMKPIELTLDIDTEMHFDFDNNLELETVTYGYELNNEDEKIYNFSSCNKGGVTVDLQAIITEFKKLQEQIATMSGNLKGDEDKKKFEELAGKVATFEKMISEARTAEENVKKLTKELEASSSKLSKFEKETKEAQEKLRVEKIDNFVEGLKKKGVVVPAFETEMKTLLHSLDDAEEKLEYKIKTGEGDVEQKLTQLELARKMFSKLMPIIEYHEMAAADKSVTGARNRQEKTVEIAGTSYELEGLDEEAEIQAYMNAHKVSYKEAAVVILDKAEKAVK